MISQDDMTITYRPLADGDCDFCVRVHHLAMREYVEPLWGWNEAQQDLLALDFLKHRDAVHEIVLIDGVPLGYVSYQLRTDGLFLNKLYLHPKYHGKGYGSEILQRIVRLAPSTSIPIQLSVLVTNPRARTFYE